MGLSHSHVIHQYVRGPNGEYLPEDPCAGDICLHRVPGESVYSVLPITNPGRAFVLAHVDAGYAAGDMLMVPVRGIVSLFDAIVDEGLTVV